MARLPILMYHDVTTAEGKGLTISVDKLEKQFSYLAEKKYQSYHFHELLKLHALPAGKNIVITFDDCYKSHKELVVPLLKKYNLKATFFAPLAFLGETDGWNTSSFQILSVEELKSLDPQYVELGYHSFYHHKYEELSNAEIEADFRRCREFASEKELNFSPIVAYPYGNFPREKTRNEIFNKILEQNGIRFGLRVGNRISRFPFKNPYRINRVDIKGEWGLSKFKFKIQFGKRL